ncbi:MAG: glycosyltransferase family 4 protein [Bacteroidetes bacterium]|nr:glycosyltransferase family 4 protein [Bacteroidota bacterium]
MRIAINTRFLLKGKLEGIGWFTNEIVKRMVINHPEHEFIFLFDRPYDPQFIFADNVIPVVIPPPARHPILWFIWFEWSVKRALIKYKADLFISTDGFLSLSSKIPQIVVVHDLAFEHFPEHLPFKFRYYLKKFTPKFVKKASHTITVSSYSKQDIIDRYHANPNDISIVYNGAHALYRPLSYDEKQLIKNKYADGAEYFVFAGALHPRKNVVRLLQAFEIFKRKQRSNMKILIIGRYAWNAEEIKHCIENHAFKNDVLHYNYMEVGELSKVIGAAYALTFVSLFEGFGIPILEAIQCGIPSIVSNTSSMPEVAGETALMIDPENVEEIANAMSTLYKDENLRTSLIHHTKTQLLKFNWDKSALDFYAIVEKFLKQRH